MRQPNAVVDKDGFFLYDAARGYTVEKGTREVRPIDVAGLVRPCFSDKKGWFEGAAIADVEAHEIAGIAARERAWRNRELQRVDIEILKATDEGNTQAEESWRNYRIALRDMPNHDADPRKWERPTVGLL